MFCTSIVCKIQSNKIQSCQPIVNGWQVRSHVTLQVRKGLLNIVGQLVIHLQRCTRYKGRQGNRISFHKPHDLHRHKHIKLPQKKHVSYKPYTTQGPIMNTLTILFLKPYDLSLFTRHLFPINFPLYSYQTKSHN
jgi:hypothetical protein